MQANNNDMYGTGSDGRPIAVPGTGTLGLPTVFSGSVREQRSKDALFRPDERMIITEFSNLTIDTGTNFEVLDISEAGELHSIVVVADNPYLQVFLQMDDFRNADPNGLTVAELLFNGDVTQTTQRRFKAIDGQSPTVGYAMVFEPHQPVRYTDRLRIILYNNIPSNKNVYGKDLAFRNSATLPTPATPAHMAGATFEQSSLAAVSLGEMAQAMTTPVGSPAYFSGKVYNVAALSGQLLSGMKLGTDHPYVGVAGKPIFKSDPSCQFIPKEKIGATANGFRDVAYRLTTRDAAERFPGTVESPSSTVIDITCQVADAGVLNGSNNGGAAATNLVTNASYHSHLGFGAGLIGNVDAVAINGTGGTGYSNANGVATTGGTGNGLTIDITTTGNAVTNVTVTNTGSGYTHGDVVTVDAGNGDATLTITVNDVSFDSSSANYPVGKRFFYRVGGQVAMVGVCTAVSLIYSGSNQLISSDAGTIAPLPNVTTVTSLGAKSGNDFKAPTYHLKIEPGLAGNASDFATEQVEGATAVAGMTATTEFARWGLVTSQADDNPQIFVKKVDVRRRKVYSKEG